ncbi:hypothetical protein J3F83DRAFT_735032 [Trichoderma novae-zelandiae]
MRPRSVALLAACIPLGLCDANDPAPRECHLERSSFPSSSRVLGTDQIHTGCAVNCASNIRNDKGALDLRVICGDKLMTNVSHPHFASGLHGVGLTFSAFHSLSSSVSLLHAPGMPTVRQLSTSSSHVPTWASPLDPCIPSRSSTST